MFLMFNNAFIRVFWVFSTVWTKIQLALISLYATHFKKNAKKTLDKELFFLYTFSGFLMLETIIH